MTNPTPPLDDFKKLQADKKARLRPAAEQLVEHIRPILESQSLDDFAEEVARTLNLVRGSEISPPNTYLGKWYVKEDKGTYSSFDNKMEQLLAAHNKAAYAKAVEAVGEDEDERVRWPDQEEPGRDMDAANRNDVRAKIRTNLKQSFQQGENNV